MRNLAVGTGSLNQIREPMGIDIRICVRACVYLYVCMDTHIHTLINLLNTISRFTGRAKNTFIIFQYIIHFCKKF